MRVCNRKSTLFILNALTDETVNDKDLEKK